LHVRHHIGQTAHVGDFLIGQAGAGDRRHGDGHLLLVFRLLLRGDHDGFKRPRASWVVSAGMSASACADIMQSKTVRFALFIIIMSASPNRDKK